MIGAYYQAYKRPKCVQFVLDNYRKHYPDTDVVLVSDGGDDFFELAKQYNCHYFYEENLTCFHAPKEANKCGYPRIWDNNAEGKKSAIKKYMKRMGDKIKLIKQDYYILLEDDVFVIQKTNTEQLKYKINGNNPYHSYPKEIANYLVNKEHLSYGGCGGCIFDKHFFIDVLNNEDTDINIDTYCELTKKYNEDGNQHWWGSDTILSFLCYINEGTIGNYDGFCETWHHDIETRIKNKNIEILHQYKGLYND